MELLEREKEMAALEAALESATSARGRLVLIRGEAGIGKTSLVREFLKGIGDRAHVLTGACDDLLTSRPLGPVRDMARSEPTLAEALAPGDLERVYDALFELSCRRLRPTVWVIEDGHWADGATLDCIRHLGRRIDQTHALLILTYRDEAVQTDHPLRFVLGDLPSHSVQRISLLPLSAEAISTLAGPRAMQVFDETGGNPFYAIELLSSSGAGPPESIVDSMRSRIARLSPAAADLVELISVVPGGVRRDVLDLSPTAEGVLSEAEAGGLLESTATHVGFRHELARKAVESSVPPTRRTLLHGRVLKALVSVGEDPARIVHHAVAAGDEDAILEHGPRAARDALDVGSYPEAHRHFTTLRDAYERLPPDIRARLLYDWSYAAQAAGDIGDARTRIDEAITIWRRSGNSEGLGEALRMRSRIAWYDGATESAERYARESASVLEPLGVNAGLAASYSTLSQLAMLDKRRDDCVHWADKAIAAAKALDRHDIVASALVNKGTALAIGHFPLQTEVLREGIALAHATRTREEEVRGRLNLAWTALDTRHIDDAVALSERAIQIAEEAQWLPLLHYSIGILGSAKALQGLWFEAEDLVGPILALPDITAVNAIMLRTALAIVHVRRGHTDADQLLGETETMAERTGELQRIGPLAALRAEHAALSENRSMLREAVDAHLDALVAARADWHAGEVAYWAWRSGLEVRIPDALPDPYALVIAGDWDAAASAFGDRSMRYEEALMLAHGDDAAAVEAVRRLDQLGADPAANQIRTVLRKRGVEGVPHPPSRATRAHPAGLTSRQHEVLALLAERLSNPDIADRLFISPRTVEHHVSAILMKLDVSSRSEAVDVAIDMGVLEVT